jgi:hypothetical protein
MPSHGTGVAEAQVDVAVTVHVMEMRALRFANEGWKSRRPTSPSSSWERRRAAISSALKQGLGLWAFCDERLLLALHEGSETRAIDGFHGDSKVSTT